MGARHKGKDAGYCLFPLLGKAVDAPVSADIGHKAFLFEASEAGGAGAGGEAGLVGNVGSAFQPGRKAEQNALHAFGVRLMPPAFAAHSTLRVSCVRIPPR